MRRQDALSFGGALLMALANVSTVHAEQQTITTSLISENASGVSGTAVITDMGDGTLTVNIRADGAGADAHPTHIHPGLCVNDSDVALGAAPAPPPQYPLATLVNSTSSTKVNVPLSDLLATPHSIDIHKSAEELGVHIACSNIVRGPGQYTVAAGDTLWDIAQHWYGDPYRWSAIFEANRDRISNPNRIEPGVSLRLTP